MRQNCRLAVMRWNLRPMPPQPAGKNVPAGTYQGPWRLEPWTATLKGGRGGVHSGERRRHVRRIKIGITGHRVKCRSEDVILLQVCVQSPNQGRDTAPVHQRGGCKPPSIPQDPTVLGSGRLHTTKDQTALHPALRCAVHQRDGSGCPMPMSMPTSCPRPLLGFACYSHGGVFCIQ